MSKLRHIGLQFFADPPAEPPAATPAQEPGTPATAGTVDIEAITAQAAKKAEEAAEKKMEGVFKSMLEQQGLDAATIAQMTTEWKSKQRTPETVAAELTAANDTLKGENEALKAQMQAISKGIPADKAAQYIALAKTYPDAGKDLSKALDAALADFPIGTTHGGAQNLPSGVVPVRQDGGVPKGEAGTWAEKLAAARSTGNTAGVVAIKMAAAQDGVILN